MVVTAKAVAMAMAVMVMPVVVGMVVRVVSHGAYVSSTSNGINAITSNGH